MGASTRRSIQDLSAEVAANPNSTAFVDLAAVYRERGETERALRLCLRGLQRHPTHVEAHYELGRIYEIRGERELALDEWAIVRQLAPDHLPSRLDLVRLYLEEGRYAAAAIELEEARRIAPADGHVEELHERLRAAARAETNGVGRRAPPSGYFRSLPVGGGVQGVLLVGADGRVQHGRLSGLDRNLAIELASSLSGARAEAERVASYLHMGRLRGFVSEEWDRRIVVTSLKDRMILVVTALEVPPGKAAWLAQKASQIVESQQADQE